jgi:hypothetical protein
VDRKTDLDAKRKLIYIPVLHVIVLRSLSVATHFIVSICILYFDIRGRETTKLIWRCVLSRYRFINYAPTVHTRGTCTVSEIE